jgi:hypothetical protein
MDAHSMYTNIDTISALEAFQHFFNTSPYCFYMDNNLKVSLISALSILMFHNMFHLGDTYWVQCNGTAMGTPAAPMYATLFFAIHELTCIPQFQPRLLEYSCYIDDGFGIWQLIPSDSSITDHQHWLTFQSTINNFPSTTAQQLIWDFSARCTSINFLDLSITLISGKVSTCLYEKVLNLYLYLPPHSCHPPGVLKGHILGRIKHIYNLTMSLADC